MGDSRSQSGGVAGTRGPIMISGPRNTLIGVPGKCNLIATVIVNAFKLNAASGGRRWVHFPATLLSNVASKVFYTLRSHLFHLVSERHRCFLVRLNMTSLRCDGAWLLKTARRQSFSASPSCRLPAGRPIAVVAHEVPSTDHGHDTRFFIELSQPGCTSGLQRGQAELQCISRTVYHGDRIRGV